MQFSWDQKRPRPIKLPLHSESAAMTNAPALAFIVIIIIISTDNAVSKTTRYNYAKKNMATTADNQWQFNSKNSTDYKVYNGTEDVLSTPNFSNYSVTVFKQQNDFNYTSILTGFDKLKVIEDVRTIQDFNNSYLAKFNQQNDTKNFNHTVKFTVHGIFNKTKVVPTTYFRNSFDGEFDQQNDAANSTLYGIFNVTEEVLPTQDFSNQIAIKNFNHTAEFTVHDTFNKIKVVPTTYFSNSFEDEFNQQNDTANLTVYDIFNVTQEMLPTQDFNHTANFTVHDLLNKTKLVPTITYFNNSFEDEFNQQNDTADSNVHDIFNPTEEVLPTQDFNSSLLAELYEQTPKDFTYTHYYQTNKEYSEEVPKKTVLASCSEYLNATDKDYGYLNVTPTGPLIVLWDDDGELCLKIELEILIQVNFLRSKIFYDKWSAAFFTSLPDDNATVTGVCEKNNEALVQILWDEYVLTWRFVKMPDQNSWYLRSLEFLTTKSDWFARYGFSDSECWRFQYFSSGMFESPLDKSFKACSQSVLKLNSEEDSLDVFVFLLKNKFQAQAFIRNETFYDHSVC